ncbi:hypothetical protein ACRALDRAFT_2126729 [Sodiomyces alcalophilus JCM 7366]|uniref:uncharacterized protein n=1 Tax=Sodiomyces alcalophilus JCM 7366 TaxID=591952 RepID=UPI0039B55504
MTGRTAWSPGTPALRLILPLMTALLVFLPSVTADGVGLLGGGKWMFNPVCASSCRRLIDGCPLLCLETINGTDSVHLPTRPPTPECHLKDAAYMRTLALCIERSCAIQGGIYLSTIEKYWEGHLATVGHLVTGDWSHEMQPIRSYSEALRLAHQDVELIGRENMATVLNRQPLNQTSLIDETDWLRGYNGQTSFQEAELTHGRNSIAIAVTTCAIPILFSLLRFLPAYSVTASHLSVWLNQPFWGHRYRVPVVGNLGTMPTRAQALFIAYILLTNIVLGIFPLHLVQPHYRAPSQEAQIVWIIGDRTGALAMANFVALFLFASRNNILLWITNWSHSTYLLLHRWIGYACILHTVMHSILMLALYDRFRKTLDTVVHQPLWYWGIVATLSLVLIWPASVLPVRQKAYQFFLATHQLLAALSLITTFLHIWYIFEWDWGYEIWVYIAGAIWFLDRALRVIRIIANGGVRTATVIPVGSDGEYLRVDIEGVASDGHAYVYFPTLSWRAWEAHPFSILSSYAGPVATQAPRLVLQGDNNSEKTALSSSTGLEKSGGYMAQRTSSAASSTKGAAAATGPLRPCTTLLIRPLSGMTKLLAAKAAAGSVSLPILLESSYYSNPSARNLDRCASFVGIAGGVGITAVLPAARRFGGLRTRVCWGMRSDDLFQAVTPELERLSADRPGILFETSIGARLPIADILRDELLREDTGDIGIIVCGPPGMADECRRVIGEVVGSGKVKKGVIFVDDAFSW